MVKHIESWDVDPARVVRSLLKPSAKVCSGRSNVGAAGLHAASRHAAYRH